MPWAGSQGMSSPVSDLGPASALSPVTRAVMIWGLKGFNHDVQELLRGPILSLLTFALPVSLPAVPSLLLRPRRNPKNISFGEEGTSIHSYPLLQPLGVSFSSLPASLLVFPKAIPLGGTLAVRENPTSVCACVFGREERCSVLQS